MRKDLVTKLAAFSPAWTGKGHCGRATHYTQTAGSLYVTKRVKLGFDFVLGPETSDAASLEITGTGLDETKDRMLLVNCQDTCGLAQPTSQAVNPMGPHVGAFQYFTPIAKALSKYTDDPFLVGKDFTTTPDRYCFENDLEVAEQPAKPLYDRNLYHQKCVVDGCSGDDCYCDGFRAGDDAESSALCLPQYECLHLCQLVDGCFGIDMHSTKNRCFLKTEACQSQLDDTK